MESNQQHVTTTTNAETTRVRYDRARLKQELREQSTAIRGTKAILHRPHGPETWKEQRRLLEQKDRATLLCSIAARIRGRVHLAGQETREEQEERIAVALVAYVRGDE